VTEILPSRSLSITCNNSVTSSAASGHNLYVKSAHVYLQDMLELEQTHPNLDAAFKSGLHVVRRSDRFWCGFFMLFTGLIIYIC
jgi:hypothetical protein